MKEKKALLKRLNEIGESLQRSGKALALLGLGSVGIETVRLDQYSDLDFFAIVEDGYKQEFMKNLDWLSSINPIIYQFANTKDGYQLLFADGIFCEFAIFETWELSEIPYSEGRIIWKNDDFDESLCIPKKTGKDSSHSKEWLLNELMISLYVGLNRYYRGEKLSAFYLIQGHAVNQIIELLGMCEVEQAGYRDQFAAERRFEQRYPQVSKKFPEFLQGYERSKESAKAMINYLDERFNLHQEMKQRIVDLTSN